MTSTTRRAALPTGLAPAVPVPTGRQASAFDAWAIDELGVPQPTLMENAGRAAAQVLQRLHPSGRVLVLAGGGNNGGDGWVAARTLRAWGRDLRVLTESGSPPSLDHGWELDVRFDHEGGLDPVFADVHVVVDALLGTGLDGPPRDRQTRWIEALEARDLPVVALDVPSGVVADTGAVPGAAVTADVTVTFGAPKLGLLLHPGRARAGRIVVAEIGFPPASSRLGSGRVATTSWAHAHRLRRPPVTHKKAVGSLLVCAGDRGMAGAAVLAARAALRAGVGLVRLASDPANREIVQSAVPEALFVDRSDPAALREAAEACSAWVVGPGWGLDPERVAELEPLLELERRVTVLDADALTLLARGDLGGPRVWADRHDLVVTPHLGELARLWTLPEGASDLERLRTALDAAQRWGGVVLAKGAPTVVAEAGGGFLVDVMGSSDLAAAGMGDALAGVIGAYAAQGLAPFVAAGLALHDTGLAHRLAALGAALIPSDVVEALPRASDHEPEPSPLGLDFVTLDVPAAW